MKTPVAFSRFILVLILSACSTEYRATVQDSLPEPPGPQEVDGKALWAQRCQSCHGTLENTNKKDRTVDQIRASITNINEMKSIPTLQSLTEVEIIAIAQALRSEVQPPNGELLWSQHCQSCHGSISNTDKKNRTAEQIVLAISDVTTMKNLSNLQALTDEEINAIAAVLKTGPIVEESAPRTIILGTRYYVASRLRALFSSATNDAASTKVNQLVDLQPAAFGGPCVPYEGASACSGDRLVNRIAPVQPPANVSRQGLLIRTCQEVLAIDAAVNRALQHVTLLSTASATTQNLSQLAEVFMPGKPLDSATLNSLLQVFQTAKAQQLSNLDAWRFTLLPLCRATLAELL